MEDKCKYCNDEGVVWTGKNFAPANAIFPGTPLYSDCWGELGLHCPCNKGHELYTGKLREQELRENK